MLQSHCALKKAQNDLIRDEESSENYCNGTKRTLFKMSFFKNKMKYNSDLETGAFHSLEYSVS